MLFGLRPFPGREMSATEWPTDQPTDFCLFLIEHFFFFLFLWYGDGLRTKEGSARIQDMALSLHIY